MIPAGLHLRISSDVAEGGSTTENTRASRTRRAINCVYCDPKSMTTTQLPGALMPRSFSWRLPAEPPGRQRAPRRSPPPEKERAPPGGEPRALPGRPGPPRAPPRRRRARSRPETAARRSDRTSVRIPTAGRFRAGRREPSRPGRRGREPSPGPLLEERIVAEARIVVGVGQEKEEDSEEERGREEKGGLAQEAHVPFDSTRIRRCYRFVS